MLHFLGEPLYATYAGKRKSQGWWRGNSFLPLPTVLGFFQLISAAFGRLGMSQNSVYSSK
jgi:hypothetical protein